MPLRGLKQSINNLSIENQPLYHCPTAVVKSVNSQILYTYVIYCARNNIVISKTRYD